MELIGKLVNFIMSTISNWIGSNELIRDVFKIKDNKTINNEIVQTSLIKWRFYIDKILLNTYCNKF